MVNRRLSELASPIQERFRIVLIPSSREDVDHLQRSIANYKLNVGEDLIVETAHEKPLIEQLKEFKPVLYLSTNAQNVREAIRKEFGAAIMFQRDHHEHSDEVLRVAFDGDGVLFSDKGPLIKFFKALERLDKQFIEIKQNSPIRTYLVTSRGTASPGLRVLWTLQEKRLEINEAHFLSGAQKGPVLKAIKPHIFFDDQMPHVDGALQNGVIGAHVPYGVSNE